MNKPTLLQIWKAKAKIPWNSKLWHITEKNRVGFVVCCVLNSKSNKEQYFSYQFLKTRKEINFFEELSFSSKYVIFIAKYIKKMFL